MFKALFYKEWIKTRRVVILELLLFCTLPAYALINLAHAFRAEGAVNSWANAILMDSVPLPSVLQWMPLLGGILIALAQYVPEMENKRLKLTLHLPMSETRIISVMLFFGLSVLLIALAIAFASLLAGLSSYFAPETVEAAAWKVLPWFVSGIAAYLFTAWICLEPTWRGRIPGAAIAICILACFHISAISGGYVHFIPYLTAMTAIAFLFPFHSSVRFKDGIQ